MISPLPMPSRRPDWVCWNARAQPLRVVVSPKHALLRENMYGQPRKPSPADSLLQNVDAWYQPWCRLHRFNPSTVGTSDSSSSAPFKE